VQKGLFHIIIGIPVNAHFRTNGGGKKEWLRWGRKVFQCSNIWQRKYQSSGRLGRQRPIIPRSVCAIARSYYLAGQDVRVFTVRARGDANGQFPIPCKYSGWPRGI